MFLSKIINKNAQPEALSKGGLETQQLAVAILLFRFVRIDGKAKMLELIHMSELLRREFSLSQDDLEELVKMADSVSDNGASSTELAAEIVENLDTKSRLKLLEYLWVLAYSDDHLDDAEIKKINAIAQSLKLTTLQQAQCQENAEIHLGL